MSDTHSPESAPSAPTPDQPPVDMDAAKNAIRQAQESGEALDKLPRQQSQSQSPSELASLADAIDALPEKIAQAWAQLYPQPPKQEKVPKQKNEEGEKAKQEKETPATPRKRTFAQLWFGE